MATAPFLPVETIPGDNDIVSQYPAVARTFRDIMEDWMLVSHDTNGNNDRLALIDKTAAVPAGVAGLVTLWQEAGVLKWRYGVAAVQNLLGADMAANSIKGNLGAIGPAEDLTGTQATTLLDAFVADSGAGGTKGLVPAPPAASAAARKVLGAGGAFVHTGAPHAVVIDQKTIGTAGGSFAAGGWQRRDLNTALYDPAVMTIVASNSIVLQAGTYVIEWSAPAYAVGNNQSRLHNATDNTQIQAGSSEFVPVGEPSGICRSTGIAQFTLGAAKSIQVQHQCDTGFVTVGFGVPSGFTSEVYTIVKIWKVG